MSEREAVPIRIQRKRTKGWRMPPGTVYVGRPTEWGNPWIVGTTIIVDTPWYMCREFVVTPEIAVALYRAAFEPDAAEIRAQLAGKNLACWCPLEDADGSRVPCHADVLLELANPGWTS